ncbi:MAG TPA: hypothetical protein VHQ68_11135, partial [Propionibacteriaceae bacterium]|nr:hypothetical protein [Propionibacteriaceae bacterium]
LRWVREHAQRHCPKPEPTGSTAVVEIDEVWHFVEKTAFIYQLANPSEGGRNHEAGNNGWWPTGLVRWVSCARSMR